MRIFRSKRSWGGWLALFALGLQLTLSFGHIHAEDLAPLNVAAQSQGASQNAPADDHHDGDKDFCAICAVMHMAGTTLLPSPPAVALPVDVVSAVVVVADLTALQPPARQSFQARAPPQA